MNISHCQKHVDTIVFFFVNYIEALNLDSLESNILQRNCIQFGLHDQKNGKQD